VLRSLVLISLIICSSRSKSIGLLEDDADRFGGDDFLPRLFGFLLTIGPLPFVPCPLSSASTNDKGWMTKDGYSR
jgi:hypothetical protein